MKHCTLIILLSLMLGKLSSQPMDNVINFNIFDSNNRIVSFYKGDLLYNKDYRIKVYTSEKGLTNDKKHPAFPKEYKTSGIIYKMSCTLTDSINGWACYSMGIKYQVEKSLRVVVTNKKDSMV